jgi:hypothetical protein
MKKLVASLIVTGMLVGVGTALAQPARDASHPVIITIPSAVMIRIMDGGMEATDPTVTFNFGLLLSDYLDAVNDGTALPPTATFTDVQVLATNGWTVTVSAASNNSAFALSSVVVRPASPSTYINSSLGGEWTLGETATNLFTGSFTGGWQSLGFGGGDYLLFVDGSEPAGVTTITVTYTIDDL